MLVSGKIDTYRKRDRYVLDISTGPGGWLYCSWSLCLNTGRFELLVEAHHHGLTTLGRITVRLGVTNVDSTKLQSIVRATRSVVWNPSGEMIAIVEGGHVLLFSVKWLRKTRETREVECSKISMFQASEIHYTLLAESAGQEHEKGGCSSSHSAILVKLSVLHRSVFIGATSASLVSQPLQPSASLLVGTDSGAVLRVDWNNATYIDIDNEKDAFERLVEDSDLSSESEAEDVASQRRRLAHTETVAGRLLAEVVLSALSGREEYRDLVRLWKRAEFNLAPAAPESADTPATMDIGEVRPAEALTPAVPADDAAEQCGSLNGGGEGFESRSYRVPVNACSICQLLYNSASHTLLCLYQDGSISFSLIGDALSAVRRSARIHPVSMVAYSLYGTVPSVASTHAHTPAPSADCAPSIFELGVAGAYRSSDYVTGWDVEALLELTPTLLQKVSRMRSLVTGKAEEEIGRVVSARFVEGDSSTHVLCLVQCRHIPSLTYVSDYSAHDDGTGQGNLLGERMESLFLVLFKLTPPQARVSTTIGVQCVQSVCVEKYHSSREEGQGVGADSVRCQLEVMRVQPDGNAHALLLHSSGLVTCRALNALQTALFALRTDTAQDLPRSLPVSTRFAVSLNRLVVSMSSPLQLGLSGSGAESVPLTMLSRLAVVPLLTSGTSGGLPGHRSGLLVDLVDEELLCPAPDRDEDQGSEQGKEGDPSMYSTSLDSWRLRLPGRLMEDVRRLQALSMSNPQPGARRLYKPSRSCLLVADSNSCNHSRGVLDIGSSTAYLAMCTGGEVHSMKPDPRKDGTRLRGTLLWVYNRRTRRWRSSRLTAGIKDSRARLVKNIPVDSGAEARAIGVGDCVAPAENGCAARGQRRRSENDIPLGRSPEQREHKALDGSSEDNRHKAAFSVQALLTPWSTAQLTTGSDASSLRSSTVSISLRSHLAGDPIAVLSIAWFSTHSLVLLTLRRSSYCIELISRVVTKTTSDAGKPLPVVHQIIALPPGYLPTALETVTIPAATDPAEMDCGSDSDGYSVDSSPLGTVRNKPTEAGVSELGGLSPRGTARTQSGVNPSLESGATSQQCAVVVTDGITLLCYRVCALGKLASTAATTAMQSAVESTVKSPTRTHPSQFFVVSDYSVSELWDVNLSSLKVFSELFAEQVCNSAAASGSPFPERHSPQLPLRELRPFLQSAPYRDDQGLHEAVVSGRFDGPKVSLLALDASGCVWLIDTSRSACFLINAGPVHRISQVQLGRIRPNNHHQRPSFTRSLSRGEDRQSQLYETFIFHFIRERSAQAQSRLLYIFQKTSLIQYLRHSCAGEVERCSLQRSTLWVPMQWLCKPQDIRKHRRRDADTVHNFSDADIPANRIVKDDAGIHSVATVSLPSLPSGTQLLYVSGDGVRVVLSCGTVDLTQGSARRDAFAHAQLYFLPVLCAMLSSIVEGDIHASVVNVEFTVARSLQKDTAVKHVSRLLCQRALSSMCSTASGTAHLVSHCEQLVKRWTESKGFTHDHAAYCRLTGLLFDADGALLCEVLSRLGRKLEPSVSRLLFPARIDCPFSAESNVESPAIIVDVVGLFNAALTVGHIHHAARLLSLACEAVGGSETHISTAASLFLALELLGVAGNSLSLRNVMECFDFCTRLEDTLVMHSRSIFGDRAPIHPAGEASAQHSGSLDSSYVRTVKSRAVSLIASTMASVGKKSETPKSAVHQLASSNSSIPSPLTSASPALPYYIGMGVGWIISKATQNLAGQAHVGSGVFPAATHTDHSVISNSATVASNSRSQLQLHLQAISTEEDGTFERAAQSTTELLRSVLLRSSPAASTVAPRCCAVIDALEIRHGAVLLSRMLSRTSNIVAESTRDATTVQVLPSPDDPQAPLESDRSPTLLTLVMIFQNLFTHSSHYCNAAALMASLMENAVAADLLKHHLLSSGPSSSGPVSAVDSHEKVRRILYVFRLSKALARDSSQTAAYLMQRVSAQYLKRVVEADVSPFPQGSSHHGTPHAAMSRSCSSEAAVLAAARAADYFELTDDMIDHSRSALPGTAAESKVPVQRERLRSRGDSFRDILPPPQSPGSPGSRVPNPPQTQLTLLELLKSLALSLLLIGDSAAVGLLLSALSRPLAIADIRLSTAVRAVPPPSRLSTEPRAETDEEGDFVWELSPAQYEDLVDALTSRV